MVELLSPVGNFDSLKAAVQNGADSVYFGYENFSARAYASNFNMDNLEKAINYAKLHGVKTHLTLNTLIKDDELKESLELAKRAYELGIDAIIVQDIGLGKLLIDTFPDLDIHASTQMSIHNLQGVLELEKLGFKRAVLSRELSINEIGHICRHCNIEIECFIHGAICISYSGQCLFSSMIGGRSGNRGRCAQPCRLPYTLLENDTPIDSGYLLSARDLCGLEYIPELINLGVTSFKIEGRMKSPTYVSTVTRIYRKYIDLALSNNPYKIDELDKKHLLQVFNRGQSSCGHLDDNPNRHLVCKEKPNNMGLFLGKVENYTKNRYITVKLKETLVVGDSISLENESGIYTISELMENGKNISRGEPGQTVEIGRMRGAINLGDKIYKMSSKKLSTISNMSMTIENRKIPLNCHVSIKRNKNISISITSATSIPAYKKLNITYTLDEKPVPAKNQPLTKERISIQINKTTNTPYEFKNIDIDLDKNLFLPKISSLNELRRSALKAVEEYAIKNIQRTCDDKKIHKAFMSIDKEIKVLKTSKKRCKDDYDIALLLNVLNKDFDYSKLHSVDKIYIPLKFFGKREFHNALETLSSKANLYIYLPTIIKANYKNILYSNIDKTVKKFHIKGFVFSNISNILFLKNLDNIENFDLVANYTFNVFNHLSVDVIKNMGLSTFTLSPEMDIKSLSTLCAFSSIKRELIVYGKIPVLNMNYCVLGESTKCYPDCSAKCNSSNRYFLQDRMKAKFPLIPDNVQAVTTVYNYRNLSLSPLDTDIDVARIDILYEDIDEINRIIDNEK